MRFCDKHSHDHTHRVPNDPRFREGATYRVKGHCYLCISSLVLCRVPFNVTYVRFGYRRSLSRRAFSLFLLYQRLIYSQLSLKMDVGESILLEIASGRANSKQSSKKRTKTTWSYDDTIRLIEIMKSTSVQRIFSVL